MISCQTIFKIKENEINKNIKRKMRLKVKIKWVNCNYKNKYIYLKRRGGKKRQIWLERKKLSPFFESKLVCVSYWVKEYNDYWTIWRWTRYEKPGTSEAFHNLKASWNVHCRKALWKAFKFSIFRWYRRFSSLSFLSY